MKKVIGYIVILILFAGSICGITFGIMWNDVNNKYQNSIDSEYIQQLEQTIENLTNYQEELLLQIDNLTKENHEYISKNEELNNTVTTLTGQVDNLTKQVEEYTAVINENNTTISELEDEINNLKNNVLENQTLINKLNEQIESLQSQNNQLQTTINNHLVTISTLNGTIDTLNETIENLKNDKNNLQSQINKLISQVESLEQEIENYESIIESLQRENYAMVIFKIENEVVSTQSIKKGTHPTTIEDERLLSYDFKGWTIENTSDIVDPYTYNIESNITFVAKFEKSYTVTFKVEDSIVNTQSVTAGQYATDYVVSNTEEYVFDYWSVNGVKVDDITTYQINTDTEFVAVLKYYKTVTYQVEGQEDNVIKVLEGNKIAEKYVPTFTKNEYFVGWKLNNELVDPTSLIINDNIILVADVNYINDSYEVKSLINYNLDETYSYRVTITFDIEDNNLISFDILIENKGSSDLYIEIPIMLTFNYVDYCLFSREGQDIVLDIPLSANIESPIYSNLLNNDIDSYMKIKLKYNENQNEWELKEYSEYVSMQVLMSIGKDILPSFDIMLTESSVKEN